VSAPLATTRALMLERDTHRCVKCGRRDHLEAQHRRRAGMGGSRVRPLIADLVTACGPHNEAFEHVGQAEALRYGWKVRAWVTLPELVPAYYWLERRWCRLSFEGLRSPITFGEAMEMMQDVYGDAYVIGKGLVA
jgi:hypothetical protein